MTLTQTSFTLNKTARYNFRNARRSPMSFSRVCYVGPIYAGLRDNASKPPILLSCRSHESFTETTTA